MTHSTNIIANHPTNLTVIDNTSDNDIKALVTTIAQAAEDRKAEDIVILKVTEVSYLTDYFVIITGFSRTQVKAIAEAIEERVQSNPSASSPTNRREKTMATGFYKTLGT